MVSKMASAAKCTKRESVTLKMFKKWSCNDDFDTECQDNVVTLIRCKICAEHYPPIRREAASRGISGPPLTAIVNYVNGASYVHKVSEIIFIFI